MLGFPVGILAANAFEWYAHKYILHGTPNEKLERHSPYPPAMKTHWAHHSAVRRAEFHDEAYHAVLENDRTRAEIRALLVLAGVSTLSLPVAPFFALGLYYGGFNYWWMHRKAHLHPEWAKEKLPWHYDHHMNPDQDANWCVTRPWFDYVMGTRVVKSVEAESNPLGMRLPKWVERPLNRVARKLRPRTFERMAAA